MYRFEILHEESDVIYTLADQVLILFWILNGNIKSVNSHKFLQNEGHFLRKVTHYQIFNQKKKNQTGFWSLCSIFSSFKKFAEQRGILQIQCICLVEIYKLPLRQSAPSS